MKSESEIGSALSVVSEDTSCTGSVGAAVSGSVTVSSTGASVSGSTYSSSSYSYIGSS